jgi:hypothetical protein
LASLPSSSAIPRALVQFLAVAAGVLPQGSTVWFGEELPTYTAPVTLQVSEITGDQSPAEIGGLYRREETFALVCSLTVFQGGSQDFPGLLGAVMDSFSLVSRAVGNNPSLNSSVRYAQVGNFLVSPVTDPNGLSAVTLDFSVRCEARVNSLS